MLLARKSRQAERKITVIRSNDGNHYDKAAATEASSSLSSTLDSSKDLPTQPVQNTSQMAAISERQLNIIAPAGKLGVILDSRPGGEACVIKQIKDDSPIQNEIHLGDKVIAVDDEDVSKMKAFHVSSKFDVELLFLIFSC